jgi:hypothetical protein
MANKYSKFTLQPYTSQYVNDGKVQIAGILRERWQENKANHDKLARAAGAINVMGQDQEIKDKAIEKVRGDFSGIVENNNYEDALSVVSKSTNEFLTNEGIQTAQQSYQNYIEEQKQANTLRMQGINVLFDEEYIKDENGNVMYDGEGRPMTQPKSSAHRSYYQDDVTGKMVKNVYQGTAQAQLNYSQKKQQIIETIATDPIALQRLASKTSMNPDALLGYLVYGDQVSEQKAFEIADALTDVYLQENEGIQEMRKYMENDLNQTTGNTFTGTEAYNSIQGSMRALVMNQIGTKLAYMQDAAYIAGIKNSPNQNKLNTFYTNATQNSQVITGTDVFDMESDFGDDGSINTGEGELSVSGITATDKSTWIDSYQTELMNEGMSKKEAYGKAANAFDATFKENLQALAAEEGIEQQGDLDDPYFQNVLMNMILDKRGADRGFVSLDKTVSDMFGWNSNYPPIDPKDPSPFKREEYSKLNSEIMSSSVSGSRADVRLMRELELAKEEGRPPRVSVLSMHKKAYLRYLKDQYKDVYDKDMSDKDFINKVSSAQQTYEVTAQKVYQPSNAANKAAYQQLVINGNQRMSPWVMRRADGSYTNTVDDVKVELGYGKFNNSGEFVYSNKTKNVGGKEYSYEQAWNQEIKDGNFSGITNGGQIAGSYVMNMTNVDGNSVSIEVGNSNEGSSIFSASHDIITDLVSNAAYDHRSVENAHDIGNPIPMMKDGKQVTVIRKVHYDVDPNSYQLIPVITYNYFDPNTIKQDDNGNMVGNAIFTADKITGLQGYDMLVDDEMEAYMNSGLLGTDINVGQKSKLSNPAQ